MNSKKFAGMAYDVTDFVSEGRIDYLVDLTKGDSDELTKTAHIPSREEADQLPGEDFALVIYHPHLGFMKKYAMSDKYITKLNMKLFADNVENYPSEIAKTASYYFSKAAKHFKIAVPDNITKLASGKHVTNIVDLSMLDTEAWQLKQASLEKTASTSSYALANKKKYPLDTKEQIKTACAYFETHATKFSPEDALSYAIATKRAANFNGIPAGDLLNKYASVDPTQFNNDFANNIKVRKTYVSEDAANVYEELLEKSAEFGIIKTAKYLAQVDRSLGVSAQWNRGVADPFLSVFGMDKEAEVCCHNGKKIRKEKMVKAASGIVDEATLSDLAGEHGVAVFDSLPTPLKTKITDKI